MRATKRRPAAALTSRSLWTSHRSVPDPFRTGIAASGRAFGPDPMFVPGPRVPSKRQPSSAGETKAARHSAKDELPDPRKLALVHPDLEEGSGVFGLGSSHVGLFIQPGHHVLAFVGNH